MKNSTANPLCGNELIIQSEETSLTESSLYDNSAKIENKEVIVLIEEDISGDSSKINHDKEDQLQKIQPNFKNVGSYRSTNLAVSENDKLDIRWESYPVENELFN